MPLRAAPGRLGGRPCGDSLDARTTVYRKQTTTRCHGKPTRAGSGREVFQDQADSLCVDGATQEAPRRRELRTECRGTEAETLDWVRLN